MPLEFFLWGHEKSVVYGTLADTREELIVRIHAPYEQIQLKNSNVWQSPALTAVTV
jgi:hypothetical protein